MAVALSSFLEPDPFPAPFDLFVSLGDFLPLLLPLPAAFGPVVGFRPRLLCLTFPDLPSPPPVPPFFVPRLAFRLDLVFFGLFLAIKTKETKSKNEAEGKLDFRV